MPPLIQADEHGSYIEVELAGLLVKISPEDYDKVKAVSWSRKYPYGLVTGPDDNRQ